jgi:NAD-dependent deacetylase
MSKIVDRKPHLVVMTGAGMSAESGLKTFRDSGGLWEGYDVRDVATPDAWHRNQRLVLQFYNERRRALKLAQPNQGHRELAALEDSFRISIITQNVDDLHERAGSTSVLHLHGELTKSRSVADSRLVYNIEGTELRDGDRCELGSQLRPHIVWFGEEVPLMEQALELVAKADIFVVIGSSLVVYPAAGLVNLVPEATPCYLVDLKVPEHLSRRRFTVIEKPASQGVLDLVRRIRIAKPTTSTNTTKMANVVQ